MLTWLDKFPAPASNLRRSGIGRTDVIPCPTCKEEEASAGYFFDHEKLDIYHFAIQFVVCADEIMKGLPRGRANLADQLRRAGSSIPLNIAEGAGEYAPMKKARFYRMAKRSATECSSILDILQHLKLIDEAPFSTLLGFSQMFRGRGRVQLAAKTACCRCSQFFWEHLT